MFCKRLFSQFSAAQVNVSAAEMMEHYCFTQSQELDLNFFSFSGSNANFNIQFEFRAHYQMFISFCVKQSL